MTLEECTELLTPLALAMRASVGVPTFKAYAALLKGVPVHLAATGLEQLAASGIRFFPTAPEIQAAAEKARRQFLALHPWEPCCECEEHPRWREVELEGVKRLERCPCLKRHQTLLEDRGLLHPIAVLPGEVEPEERTEYPSDAQIPASVREQLIEISGRKLMR